MGLIDRSYAEEFKRVVDELDAATEDGLEVEDDDFELDIDDLEADTADDYEIEDLNEMGDTDFDIGLKITSDEEVHGLLSDKVRSANKLNRMCDKYADMYMDIAQRCSLESTAHRKKVGCVIITTCGGMAHGWNGMPPGSPTEVCENAEWETKPEVIHAEDNAIRKASNLDTTGAVVFVTLMPCGDCAELLIKAGVARVIYRDSYRCADGVNKLKSAEVQVQNISEINYARQ